ncbi:MAG: ABC transporter permease [Thermotoga caldifontis]|uniref:ABC transporter permease n=1 Tax=Thermotoga caldifontis TaxID=1508419 RepID=UPI003C7C8E00
MRSYIIKRILIMVPTLLVLSFVVFLLLYIAPGDPVMALITPDAPKEAIELMRQKFGLDVPIHVRYFNWLKELLKGNLGFSYSTGRPVLEMILARLPATFELMGYSILFSTVAGIFLGLQMGMRPNSLLDRSLLTAGMVIWSIPQFFISLVLIYIFSIRLGWLPIGGRTPLSGGMLQHIKHLVLPCGVLTLTMTVDLMRYTRANVVAESGKPYVRTAVAKGLTERRVYYVHIFRNASIPVVVLLILRLVRLVGGVVVVESVFSWPGMGTLLVNAISNRDYPVVLGILFITGVAVLVASLMIDVVTALINPKVRLGFER